MSKRRPGRPPDTPQKRLRLALTARRIVDEELAAMSRPSREQAIDRAASRLKVSAKTVVLQENLAILVSLFRGGFR